MYQLSRRIEGTIENCGHYTESESTWRANDLRASYCSAVYSQIAIRRTRSPMLGVLDCTHPGETTNL
jgi:hypothetical protein